MNDNSTENRGFTLVEMLAVLAIIALLLGAILPSIVSIGTARAVAKAGGDIASILEQARSYAMANNTYAYVGFYEADASQSEGTRPQSAGSGRLYVGVVSTKDGTNGYSEAPWPANSATNSNLGDITGPRRFEGVHLVDPASLPSIKTLLPNMDYSTDSSGLPSSLWVLGSVTGDGYGSAATGVPFNAPARTAAAQAICTFSQVIQFTPSGAANIVTSAEGAHRQVPYVELGLIPTHGNQVTVNVLDCAGVQVDGLTGVVRLYRAGQG